MADSALTTRALLLARLNEAHDCLTLALDASVRPGDIYSQAEREARSYMRTALRRVGRILEAVTEGGPK